MSSDESGGSDDAVDWRDDWSDDRRQTAYEEARAVIEAQNATMTDIDDKAMRAVRLIAVIIGLLVAGLQYDATTQPTIFNVDALTVAFAFLVLAFIAGIATYDESNLYVGADGEFIEVLAHHGELDFWDQELCVTLSGMIAENHDEISRNARFLRAMNALLIAGIIFAVASVVI